jgi:hypothetical protein
MSKFKSIRHKFIPEPEKEMRDEILMIRWDYKGYNNIPAGTHYLQHDWNQTLITKINECRNWLHNHFNRDNNIFDFNTLTTSFSGVMIFDSMPYFHYTPNGEITNPSTIGVLMGRYVVDIDYSQGLDRIYLGTQEQPKLACIIIDRLGL